MADLQASAISGSTASRRSLATSTARSRREGRAAGRTRTSPAITQLLTGLQVNGEFDFDRLAEVFGDVYRALAPPGTSRGPYAYIAVNHDFWTSTDFLARFQGNFLKAARTRFLAPRLFSQSLHQHHCRSGSSRS
jgi:hypothetical protein